MLAIPRDIGGTIRVRAPRRATIAGGADATPTVVIHNEDGGTQIASQNATLDAVNTTTDGVTAAGATTVPLTATTNIVRDDEYWIGPNALGQSEFVKVAGITSADSVTLRHPTLYGYATGVSFEGTYQSVVITAAQVADSFTNWRAVFSWTLLGVAQPPLVVRFDVVRHWLQHQPCTMSELRGYDPKVTERVADSFDWEWAMAQALGDVLREVNQTRRALSALGEDDWVDLVALKVLSDYVGGQLGDLGEVYRATWQARYQSELKRLETQLCYDEDEDGVIEAHEKGRGRGGMLYRG